MTLLRSTWQAPHSRSDFQSQTTLWQQYDLLVLLDNFTRAENPLSGHEGEMKHKALLYPRMKRMIRWTCATPSLHDWLQRWETDKRVADSHTTLLPLPSCVFIILLIACFSAKISSQDFLKHCKQLNKYNPNYPPGVTGVLGCTTLECSG